MRYEVPHGPEVAGFSHQAEVRGYEFDEIRESEIEGPRAEAVVATLKNILDNVLGTDNAVEMHNWQQIPLSKDEVDHLKALGYLEK